MHLPSKCISSEEHHSLKRAWKPGMDVRRHLLFCSCKNIGCSSGKVRGINFFSGSPKKVSPKRSGVSEIDFRTSGSQASSAKQAWASRWLVAVDSSKSLDYTHDSCKRIPNRQAWASRWLVAVDSSKSLDSTHDSCKQVPNRRAKWVVSIDKASTSVIQPCGLQTSAT
eukprot:1161361-Pelagomonas_calceolata.AAC.16